MDLVNIHCGVNPPKSNKKRGTEEQCIKKKQVYYYGIKSIKKENINKYFDNNQAKKNILKKNILNPNSKLKLPKIASVDITKTKKILTTQNNKVKQIIKENNKDIKITKELNKKTTKIVDNINSERNRLLDLEKKLRVELNKLDLIKRSVTEGKSELVFKELKLTDAIIKDKIVPENKYEIMKFHKKIQNHMNNQANIVLAFQKKIKLLEKKEGNENLMKQIQTSINERILPTKKKINSDIEITKILSLHELKKLKDIAIRKFNIIIENEKKVDLQIEKVKKGILDIKEKLKNTKYNKELDIIDNSLELINKKILSKKNAILQARAEIKKLEKKIKTSKDEKFINLMTPLLNKFKKDDKEFFEDLKILINERNKLKKKREEEIKK